MKTLIGAILLLVAPAFASAKGPVKKLHRTHRLVFKTTGVANARAHGGKAYAKGHRTHTNNGKHSADIYFGAPGKANGKSK